MVDVSKVIYYLGKLKVFFITDILPILVFFGLGILFIIFIDKVNHWLDEKYPIKDDEEDEY